MKSLFKYVTIVYYSFLPNHLKLNLLQAPCAIYDYHCPTIHVLQFYYVDLQHFEPFAEILSLIRMSGNEKGGVSGFNPFLLLMLVNT